jgi:hypothetical protein
MSDTMQNDTDAGFRAYVMEHPEEFMETLVALATV